MTNLKYVHILLIMKPHDVVTNCVCLNMRKAARAVTSLYDTILRETGLRATQVTLLMAVAAMDRPTISQLAEELVMDRTTLTRDLKPLAAQGFVLVRPGADRRTRLVELTNIGGYKLDAILPLWEQAQARMITDGLGLERWNTLYAELQAVVRTAQV